MLLLAISTSPLPNPGTPTSTSALASHRNPSPPPRGSLSPVSNISLPEGDAGAKDDDAAAPNARVEEEFSSLSSAGKQATSTDRRRTDIRSALWEHT